MKAVLPGCRPVVFWKAPVYDPSGYGDEARHLIKTVQRFWPLRVEPAGRFSEEFVRGMSHEDRQLFGRLQKQPLSDEYLSVTHLPAYAFCPDEKALYNIGRTVFETDRIPPPWVEACNRMDEIWVPTAFNVETFRRSGVRVPVHVVPQGIDSEFFRPGLRPLSIPGRRGFAFLSVFEWTHRKGWDLLLKAWAEAFSPNEDVCLILRTYPINALDSGNVEQIIQGWIDRFLRRDLGKSPRDVAPIIVLGTQIPAHAMPRLYASADAFVLPSRGEGWGRPYMEAMACGLPVIGTRWGGNLAFMNSDNSYLVDIEGLEGVGGQMEIGFYHGHCWAAPSLASLMTLLRRVYDHPHEARLKGARARQDVVQKWNWQMAAGEALKRLEEITCSLKKGGGGPKGVGHLPEETDRIEVIWEGPQLIYSSLANINRELCLCLMEREGVSLSIHPNDPRQLEPEDDGKIKRLVQCFHRHIGMSRCVHIRHEWPPNFSPPERGHWVIIQPWEYGRLPREWVRPMSTLVDEIWVPSRHVWKTYVSSGVPAERVHVVPNGVNPDIFRPDVQALPLDTRKRFKFLFVGGTIWRKGIDVLLAAYRSVFRHSDDVALVIKDFGQDSFYKGQGAVETIKEIQGDPTGPEILYVSDDLDERSMPGLYRACDCLVHPYRGEGFAMPVLEAMACGLPVIVTEGGATDDFCLPRFAYRIKATRRSLTTPAVNFAGGAGWVLEPDERHLQRLLRHVYEHRDEAREEAEKAAEHAHCHYSWQRVTDQVLERIRHIVGQPVARLQPH
ncbi:Glycosyltransferase involved in cell wall bisynthesis [Desulfacinum infernum DSM 9756]|uniref:Glycosyltransferase involved in cell wall bisynthesis n=1 Tax=Desulfacinum infernum DSM 9756 TaxID=1121391 RepID=A0A1M5CTB4_9BACT|nr:glycosyltransferase [Desulfacinum infernum]SHF57900.1 Glycosyltransferase involved in cell wall bisynthesis [Desulfacinum infernum DSM 9756]